MRCVIAGNSVKLFARAIHCLAKIGEEIYLEPLTKGLSLRTVNSSRSAYACFLFLLNFFQSYDDGLHNISGSENTPPEDILKCKLSVKSFLSVFKSLSTVEKIVDRCSIKMDLEKATLTFLLYCRHGITKTYNLSYQDCESLQAVFTKDLCPNVITAQPRIFSEVVMNFQNTQEEITLTVCPQHMKVTNYVDDEPDPEKVIRTEMVLVQEEFDKYQIGVDTEVTFCLKELKGILTFAESSGQPMDIYFEYGGKPIVFSLNSDATFEANFVLATLIDQPTSSQYSQQTNNETEQPQKTKQTQKTTRKPQKPKETESHNTNHVSVNGNNDDEFGLANDEDWDECALDDVVVEQMAVKSSKGKKQTQKVSHEEENPFEDPFEHQDLFSKKARRPPTKSQTKTTQNDGGKANEQSLRGTNPVRMLPGFVSGDLSQKYSEMPFLGGSISADSEGSPGIAVRSGKYKDGIKKPDETTIHENADLLEDSVPGTPPSKKFKSMFFSAMTDSENPSTKTKTAQETSVVLAADTDDESD